MVANFVGTKGNPGKNYTFTDLSTTPAGCPITNWLWNFGDGSPVSNAQNPQHTFPGNNNTYSVTLTVTNSSGTKTITKTVNT
jgi:PKD repeat protein